MTDSEAQAYEATVLRLAREALVDTTTGHTVTDVLIEGRRPTTALLLRYVDEEGDGGEVRWPVWSQPLPDGTYELPIILVESLASDWLSGVLLAESW